MFCCPSGKRRCVATERIEHPFSNGTEGTAWEAAWCQNCVHEHDENHGPDGVVGPGCMYLTNALTHRIPLIWQPFGNPGWWRYLPALIQCRAFEPCVCDREIDHAVQRDYAGLAVE